MHQEVPASDIVFGVLVLIPFLIGAYCIGRLVAAWHNRRYTAAWSPLIALINGTVRNNTGGDISWLDGTYRGSRVQASMAPHSGMHRSFYVDNRYFNDFTVELPNVPGDQDWKILNQAANFTSKVTGWRVVTEDLRLQACMQQTGILTELARFDRPSFRYDARTHTLQYREDITPRWIPTPQRFQEILEIMLRLAAVSAAPSKA
jgi:hypothetical protein